MTTSTEPVRTITILIHPELDPKVQGLIDQVGRILAAAQLRVIVSDKDLTGANDDLVVIGSVLKAIEAKRNDYLSPIREHIGNINDTFQAFMFPLVEARRINGDKIKEYRQKVQAEVDAAIAVEAANLKLAQAQEALTGKHTVDLTPLAVPIVPHSVNGYTGLTSFPREWKFEVVDFAALPDKYKLANNVEIRRAIIHGGVIAGVRAWQQESLRVTPH